MDGKGKIIQKLKTTRKRTISQLKDLSIQQWNTYKLGSWSLKEVVSHLIGWDYWSVKAIKELNRGKVPSYFRYYKNDDWKDMNDKIVKKFKKESIEELTSDLERSNKDLLKELKRIPQRNFNRDYGVERKGKKWTIYVELDDLAEHELKHLNQLKVWLGKI